MAGLFPRGTQKPPIGAQINPAHPLAQKCAALALFQQGPVLSPILFGPDYVRDGTTVGITPYMGAVGGSTIASNREGSCGRCAAAGVDKFTFPFNSTSLWLAGGSLTIALVRRKLDATLRNSALFDAMLNSVAAYVPFGEGTVIWRFGGADVNVTGLSFSTTVPERWIFTGGSRGKSVWQNGVKVGTSATPVTYTAAAGQFVLNGGDTVDLNYIAFYNTQWSDDLCRWWSAEPYALLYTEVQRSYQFMSALPAGFATTHHSAFGAQKPSRRHHR